MSSKFDDVFANIAGGCGGIEPLLEAFFGFLHRRTDFYVQVDGDIKAEMGFRPGQARSMLLNNFEKHPMKLYSPPATTSTHPSAPPLPINSSDLKSPDSGRKSTSLSTVNYSVSPINDVGVKTSSDTSRNKNSSNSNTNSSFNNIESNNNSGSNNSSSSSSSINELNTSSIGNNSSELTSLTLNGRYTDDGKQIPIGNGGWSSHYYWTQTLKDATVFIDLPKGTKGKQIKCNIGKKSLSLKLNDVAMIEGELEDAVRTDESLWNLSTDARTGNTVVIITLDKGRNNWWGSIIVGDPKIDCTKVDSTQRIDEYDQETQAAIRKLMTEHRDKRISEHVSGISSGGGGGGSLNGDEEP